MPKTEQLQIPGQYYQATKADGVLVGSSLPPFVEGQLRCFLHLSVGDLKWNGLVSLKDVEVGVKWWGQQNAPILLKPRNEVGNSAKIKCEAKYPIRSGPKQFTAYLKDMGVLSLSVLAHGTVIGHVDVTDIGLLCHSRPIKGFYSIISNMQSTVGKEIGMLFVSLAFHSVSGSINMESSTIPTIDMPSLSFQADKNVKTRSTGKMATERHSKKMGTEKKKLKGVRISSASPERIEYSLQKSLASEAPSFVVGPGQKHTNSEAEQKEANNGYIEAKRGVENRSSESYRKEPETPRHRSSIPGREVADTLAQLIERGQNLRNKMMLSAAETPLPSKELGAQDEEKGSFLQDILDQIDEDDSLHRADKENSPNANTYSVEQTLVDLVAGNETDRVDRIIKKLSGDSDASLSEEFSDIDDPIHEESLLTDLFYTAKSHETSESSIILSDESDIESEKPALKVSALEDAGNKRPSGRKYQRKKDRPSKPVETKDFYRSDALSVEVDEDTDSLKYLNPDANEDAEDGEPVQPQTTNTEFVKSMDRFIPEGMDLDTVTTLARVHFARVVIKTLDVEDSEMEKYNDCTFFVEYDFPVNSLEHGSKKDSYSELTRCASNKFLGKSILFNHRSVFPVHFDGTNIANWWDRQVTFKVYTRSRGEHSPGFIGKQSFALRKVFFSDAFALNESLTFTRNASESSASDIEIIFATLQVSVELAAEKGETKRKRTNIETAIDVEKLQEMQKPVRIDTKETENLQCAYPTRSVSHVKETIKHGVDRPTLHHGKMSLALPRKDTVLKSLLFIREGKSVSSNSIGRLATPTNSYLVCRMFWDEVASKSQVCWNSLDPEFNFVQAVPVALNTELIEKARNNFMVIEVWDKSLSATDDKLIGVVKVSLHPFYMSFKDPSIVKALLKSQYPVIAVDDMVKINDLFGSRDCGHLHVLLALGSKDQIDNLLEIKGRTQPKSTDTIDANRRMTMKGSEENVHYPNSDGTRVKESTFDHIFGVSIENAKNLGAYLREEIGERDCFVQYQFPEQQRSTRDVNLVWHKTPTTLFVDNPTFGFSQKHVITSFVNAPVQHLFLSSFEDRRKSSGITFELWQRSYFPNVRDCVLYKTTVPLAKIYAMMAMSKDNDSAFQAFKLPLSPIERPSDMHDEYAKLSVGISYQQKVHNKSSIDLIESKSPCVCIAVSVLRACGLKACLLDQSRKDHSRFSTTSSFNTFVKVSLSFLGAESARVSPVVARSFAPTFSFHVDFPVNVIQDFVEDEDHDESSALAYHMESGCLIIQIFQKKIKSGFISAMYDELEDDHSELLLGDCKIPLIGLLSRNTGIKGWFPITTRHRKRTRGSFSYNCDADEFENMTGGLEISLKLGKDSDRELIINTARGIGWSPLESLEMHEESFSAADVAFVGLNARVSVDKVWIAAEVLEKWSDDDIRNLRLYCRYKFYDSAALITSLVSFERTSSSADVLSANLGHKKQFQITASSALSWYLREEFIEFQFWLRIVGKNKSSVLSHTRDKLIGSVFVNASRISKNPTLHGSVSFLTLLPIEYLPFALSIFQKHSGLYPMYKFGAEFLGKSSARISVHITDDEGQMAGLNSHCSESADENYSHPSDSEDAHAETSSELISKVKEVKNSTAERFDSENGPAIGNVEEELRNTSGNKWRIIVDEALHLPTDMTSQGVRLPSTYASYQITPFHEVFYTDIINDSSKPKWNVESIERFDLCKVPNQVMNFKVFKKVSDLGERPDVHKDVLLGVATVDLFLLSTGFRQIQGWYNLVDFSGQQVGQIKVGIIPEKPLATSPSARYFRRESLTDKVYYEMPLSHQVARSLCFEENSIQGKQDVKEKTPSNSGISFDKADDSRMLDSSKSLLFSKLRDHITDLEALTRDLRIKLKGNSEEDPRYLSSVFRGDDEQNHENAEKNLHATSYKLRGLLNETENRVKTFSTSSDNDEPKSQKNTDMENDGGFSVVSSNMQTVDRSNEDERRLGKHEDSDGTSFSSIMLENSEADNDGSEVVEKIEFTKYPLDIDGNDEAFDSFDDVLNYERKNEDGESISSLVVDDIPEIHGHSQSNNGIPLDEERFLRLKSLSVDDESVDSFKIIKEAPFAGNSKQTFLEEQSHTVSRAVALDEEQSPFANDLKAFIDERTDDFHESNTVQSIASKTPIYYGSSNNEDSNESEKILETLEDSTLLTKGFLKDSSAREEDSTTQQSTHPGGCEEFPSQSQSKADAALRSDVPNFFMSREMLAQSMQKLRLAITRDCNDRSRQHDDIEEIDMESRGNDEVLERRVDRRKPRYLTNSVKVSLDKPPPLETDEINRIASIFSTKFT